MQNKLHFAITGKTAAELISERVNPEHPTMGLTTWKGAPDGGIIKSDVSIAKNHLNKNEISRLNRIVTMFIDYAELMAEDKVLMSMKQAEMLKVESSKGELNREAIEQILAQAPSKLKPRTLRSLISEKTNDSRYVDK